MKITPQTETYQKIQDWMELNLTKVEYDYYIQKGHDFILVSPKTWQNYRLGKNPIPYPKMLHICKMFEHKGFSMETIQPENY